MSQQTGKGPSPTALTIHPDFVAVKERKSGLEGWSVAFRDGFLRATNMIYRHKFRHWMTELSIPGPGGKSLSLLIIRPNDLPPRAAALIYYHGGTRAHADSRSHLSNAVRYALEGRCLVVFAHYRLPPYHALSAAFNECYAILRWAMSNSDHLRIDRGRIAVGGGSEGATLAAAVTQRAVHEHKFKLCGQLLLYPMVDAGSKSASATALADSPLFQAALSPAVRSAYLSDASLALGPSHTSGTRRGLTDLPPAYVELAQIDAMHDEGKAYAEAMRSNGVEVELNEIEGAIHRFDLLVPESEISKGAVHRRIQFLRRVFSGPACPTLRTRRAIASRSLEQR